jgi:photosystem II stability/assembly factor-like uncharacterized protein
MKGSAGEAARRVKRVFVWAAALYMGAMTPGPVLAAINDWTSLGPEGGSINAISINPRDPTTLYAGTTYASFTSGNGGRTWVKSALPMPTLIFDLQNPDTVYARPPLNYLGPLLKSTDQGKTWKDIGPPRTSITDFATSFQDTKTMFIAAIGGVFKTTNAGESWRAVNSGLPSQVVVQTLAIHPQDQNTVYVGTRGGVFKTIDGGETWKIIKEGESRFALAVDPRNGDTIYVAPFNDPVSRSTDGGKTWTTSSQRLGTSVFMLVIDPQAPRTIYACCGPERVGLDNGLWKSVDAGESWVDTGLRGLQSFAIDPRNSATLYAGTGRGVLKSFDGGKSWTPFNLGLLATPVRILAVDPQNPDTLYADVDGPVKSIDGGITFTAISGLKRSYYAMAISPQNADTIYAGSYEGLFKSTDGGGTWANTGLLANVGALAVDPRNRDIVYVGTWDSRVLKSMDGGRTWITPDFSFREYERPSGVLVCSPTVAALAIVPQDPSTIYATTSDCNDAIMPLQRSKDGGITWAKMNISMVCYLGQSCPGMVAVHPENPNLVYAGQLGGVARSTDGGETWNILKSGLPSNFNVTSLAIDSQSPTILYAMGYDWYSFGRSPSSVFKSTDGGNNWTPFGEPLSNFLYDRGSLVITSHGYNTLYAGTESGLYKAIDDTPVLSVDGQYCIGGSWKLNVGNGTTNASIRLLGTSNGQSWEVRDWRKTNRDGNWIEAGGFAAGTEGSHFLRIDINGALSNVVSFVISNCGP